MRRIFTVVMLAGLCYLSACSEDGTSVTPMSTNDTVSKGGYMQIAFGTKSFLLEDLVVNNSPVHTLYASLLSSPPDNYFTARIIAKDEKSKTVTLNLTLKNSSTVPTGVYQVVENNSTLSDYSSGQNRNYAISVGSYIDITSSSYPIKGTLHLNLYYNHQTIPATGDFKIYY